MSFEWMGGTLGAVEILDVLGLRRRSGKIQVLADSDAYAFHLDHGRIVCATSSHRTLRLGHLLLQRGAVQPLYLHDVLRGRRTIARDQALGRVLVRDGAVKLEDLASSIEQQAVEVLSRVMRLEAGTYLYHGDEPAPPGIELVALETSRIVERASKLMIERASQRVMQRLLPVAEAQLTLNVQLALVSHLLSDAELLVALNADRGGSTLARMERVLPLDQLTLQRTVISLLERDYLKAGEPLLGFDL